jgi:hypothetical protein
MGQFYRGAEATFLDDAMFKLPYEQMSTALKAKDDAINSTIQTAIKLGDFDVAHHVIDTEDAAAVKSAWDNKITGMVDQIRQNPLDYKKYQGDITGLSMDLNRDINFGDIAAIGKRKTQIDTYQEELEALYKKDPEKYFHKQSLFKEQLNAAGKYIDPDTGKYNYFNGEDILGSDTMSNIADSAVKDATGKVFEKIRVNEQGMFEVEIAGKTEGYDDKRLKDLLINYIKANPTIVSAYGQKERLGVASLEQEVNQGIEYLRSKYGQHVTSDTYKKTYNALGSHAAIYGFDEDKKNQDRAIVNQSAFTTNLTVDLKTFNNEYISARDNTVAKKGELANLWNKMYPKSQISGDLPLGQLIAKVKKLQGVTGIDYSNEIQNAKSAALRKTVLDASWEEFKKWKGANNKANSKNWEADYTEWSKTVNGSDSNPLAFYGTSSTYKDSGMSADAEKDIKEKAKGQFLNMPFSTENFQLKIKENWNTGKGTKEDRDITVLFAQSKSDPLYAMANQKGNFVHKSADGSIYFRKGGKGQLFKVHGEQAPSVSPVWLAQKGYLVAGTDETTETSTNPFDANAKSTTTTKAPSYFIAGTNKAIEFYSETYLPSNAVDNNGKNYLTASVRFGDNTTTVRYGADDNGVVTNAPLMQYFQNTFNSSTLNRELNSVKGTANLSGEQKIGNETVELSSGVLTIKRKGNNQAIVVKPGNKNYNQLLDNWLEAHLMQK